MTLETSPLVVLSAAQLTEVHVVQLLQIALESGTIQMDQWCLIMLLVMISSEEEETIKLYTSTAGTMLSLQLDHSAVNYLTTME